MPGINQLPSGSEFAAAISLIWATCSWLSSTILLWLTWSHHEGWSYLALLSISSLFSNTFSIIQQGYDITWYTDLVTEQFARKQKLAASDPELAIAGGSFGLDLALYYLQYYSYNVQAMLVMFWAAELCQLTYQVGEKRKIRRIFRKVHTAGKFLSWIIPMVTILCLRIPSLKKDFVVFILIADLPLMVSLAIGSGLMVSVTLRYVQSRQKFTHWSPPKFNSANTSEAGTNNGTVTSSTPTTNKSLKKGLYDRWLLVRFTIAFVLLAVFEVTNTLFQVTALDNNIHDAKASAPDLSAGRAIQTMFLYMPGTTPGIFLYIVFGTTAASRQKTKDLLLPEWLRDALAGFLNRFCCCCGGCCLRPRSTTSPSGGKHLDQTAYTEGGITVERSLTITSASRINRTTSTYEDDEFSNLSDISLGELNKRPDSTLRSYQISRMKPLPLAPQTPISKFTTTVSHGGGGLIGRPPPPPPEITNPAFGGGLSAIEEKSIMDSGLITRTNSDDSLRVPDDYHGLGPEHSDDSGPILPIQKPEVRFSTEIFYSSRERGERQSKNFSRPKR